MRRHDEGDFADRGNGGTGPPEGRRTGGISARQVLIFVLVLVLIIFGVANFKIVEVNFLFFTTRARVVTVIVVAAILGFIAGYFVGRPGREDRKVLKDFRDRRD